MKKIKLVALFLLITAFQKPVINGLVVGVSDGDTITVLTPQKSTVRIRLADIDAPEKNQAFGQRAKTFTSELCFQKNVRIIQHSTDRYGRIIGTVYVENSSKSINEALVEAGLAWHYKKFSNNPLYDQLEKQARNAKKGLWSQPNPIPPWEFRKQ